MLYLRAADVVASASTKVETVGKRRITSIEGDQNRRYVYIEACVGGRSVGSRKSDPCLRPTYLKKFTTLTRHAHTVPSRSTKAKPT